MKGGWAKELRLLQQGSKATKWKISNFVHDKEDFKIEVEFVRKPVDIM